MYNYFDYSKPYFKRKMAVRLRCSIKNGSLFFQYHGVNKYTDKVIKLERNSAGFWFTSSKGVRFKLEEITLFSVLN